MRAQIAFAAILAAALWGSTPMAVAQTGEFAVQVPGAIVHDGWEIQDQLQNARAGMPAGSVSRTTRRYRDWNSVRPHGSITITNGTKTRE